MLYGNNDALVIPRRNLKFLRKYDKINGRNIHRRLV